MNESGDDMVDESRYRKIKLKVKTLSYSLKKKTWQASFIFF